MKKTIFTASLFLFVAAMSFAKNPIQPENRNHIQSVNNINLATNILTIKISEKVSDSPCEMQMYDIECRNGNTAHRAFNSYQEAWDWGLKYCAS